MKHIKIKSFLFGFSLGIIGVTPIIINYHSKHDIKRYKSNPNIYKLQDNKLPIKFEYTLNAFKKYNKAIDTNTVIKYLSVVKTFDLAEDDKMFKWGIGQILLESGAKQYYGVGHPKEGQLIKSYAGAIGFCQIMPLTALGYLTNRVNYNTMVKMKSLGVEDFNFVNDKTLTKVEKIYMIKKWLTNKNNNIILWGVIMRYNIDKKGSIIKALITYNTGTNGMKKYLNNGGLLNNHKYIRGIRKKLSNITL